MSYPLKSSKKRARKNKRAKNNYIKTTKLPFKKKKN